MKIHYDWAAIKRLQDELGKDFEEKIGQACLEMDLDVLAKVLSIGSGKSEKEILKQSPPVVDVIRDVTRALNVAFHGKEVVKENPLKAVVRNLKTLFSKRGKPHTATA